MKTKNKTAGNEFCDWRTPTQAEVRSMKRERPKDVSLKTWVKALATNSLWTTVAKGWLQRKGLS